MSVLIPQLADLGFVTETLILKTWKILYMIGYIHIYLFKWSYIMYSFSENSGGKLPKQEALIFWFLLQKYLLLFLWSLRNYWSSVFEISHWGNLACPRSNTAGFIRIGFTIWDLWSFSQGDLLQECSEQWSCTTCHVSLVHLLSLIFRKTKLKSVPFLEHL